MIDLQVHLTKILLSISDWLDWSHSGITDHHRRVTFASLNLGQATGLDGAELSRLFKAAIIHDIGAVTWAEKQTLKQFDVEDTLTHCLRGQYFVSESRLASHLGDTILHHHDKWGGGNPGGLAGDEIPLHSRIIHLCDRLVIKIRRDDHILGQRQEILEAIRSR